MRTVTEQNNYVKTKDGALLYRTLYIPVQPNGSVVLIGPASNVDQHFYRTFAQFLAQNQYTVATFDYRGKGHSVLPSSKSQNKSLRHWGLFDLDAIILNVKNQFTGYEIIFIGHQVSGEIIGIAPSFQFINRIILIRGSLSLSSWKFWKLNRKLKLFFRRLPKLFQLLFPIKSKKRSKQETIKQFERRSDLAEVFKEKNHQQFYGPLLAFSFRKDLSTIQSHRVNLLKEFPNANIKQLNISPFSTGMGYLNSLGFFHLQTPNKSWKDLLVWLNNRAIS